MRRQYDISRSWQWNLQNAPPPQRVSADFVPLPGSWNWCGLPVNSPLGIAAGPLLNTGWLLYYASRGFDILVYKTVRSRRHECYSPPNLVPVDTDILDIPGEILTPGTHMAGSWAVSFGMPSQSPDVWRKDVELARRLLASGQVLVVSVVGTQQTADCGERAMEALADDFAKCAQWAVSSGAHGIEANFSCPNVSTADGQLYQQPAAAGLVAERIRNQIGGVPLVLKIGRIDGKHHAEELLRHTAPFVNGYAMTNSIAARVQQRDGRWLFDGQSRGICGAAIREASVRQVHLFRTLMEAAGLQKHLIGVGGISQAEHVQEYLRAGASSVALATAVMTNPDVGLKIRSDLQSTTQSEG